MEENRIISENTIGNGNMFVQGNVSVNHYTEGLRKQGEHDILKLLYTSPYQDRKDRNPPRVPGTCDWFVSHEHFQTWTESNSSAMLWVSADPGCGKSVLVKHLVDSVIHNTETRTVCYFFFKDDFLDQKKITSALSCILRQIFIQKPPLLSDEVLKKFQSGGETFNTSFNDLWQTLIQVAEDKNAGEIVCLLDAIDECEDQSGQGRSQLLKALCTLYGTETRRRSNLKFFLTSRPYVEIFRGLQPVQLPGLPVIHLSGESEDEIKKISLEINTYIHARVRDVGERLRLSSDECDLLLQKLKSVPNRTYLWVYLVLNYIENSIALSDPMIFKATYDMPTTVDEAYERILSKSFNAKQAKKVLQIVVAAGRPLTLKEMNFALALDADDHQADHAFGLLSEDRFREVLRNICGLCVVVVDSRVYLLHQTVKEFLVKGDDMQTTGSNYTDHEWKCSLSLQESHRVLAEICVWHLLAGLKVVSGSPTQQNWRETFLDYSAKHWASHFRQIPIETQSIMTESILRICDATSSCCQTWFSSYWITTNTEFPEGFTTLMLASYFGLNFVVRSLITMADIELDTRDDTYRRTALSWAARNGFRIVCELLLNGIREKLGALKLPFKKRAKVNIQDKYGRTPLTYAVWNGDVTLVQLLIKAGARVDLRDELDGTPLSYAYCNGNVQINDLLAKKKHSVEIENDINRLLLSAAGKGHEEVMSLLLKTNRANIEAQDGNGDTALMKASLRGYELITKMLLEAGANVNALHKEDSDTALLKACQGGHEAIANLLLEAGADVNALNQNNDTALLKACQGGHEAIANLLLKAGADVNALNQNSDTALLKACQDGHEAIANLLLKAGADVNALSQNSDTALLKACQGGHEAIANLLLKAGADVNALNQNSDTALLKACQGGHEAIANLLLKAGADINAINVTGNTALMNASQCDLMATVKLLLKAGADVNALNQIGDTALLKACQGGHEATVNLLLEAEADINAVNVTGDTTLMNASQSGLMATVKLLLKAGADVNALNKDGDTALLKACQGGHEAIANLLLKAGADINAVNVTGDTALIYASRYGYRPAVQLLLSTGADVNACNEHGDTAFIRAAISGDYRTMELLLEAGADINAVNVTSDTALIYASRYGYRPAVQFLLKAGADVNACNEYGDTALIKATRYPTIVKWLLEAGADANICNKYGDTALKKASRDTYKTSMKMMLEAGENKLRKR